MNAELSDHHVTTEMPIHMDVSINDRAEQDAILRDLRRISRIMDSSIGIPFTRIRFGLDSLIGLIPGAGDAATMLVSLYAIMQARDLGVSKTVLMKMARNTLIDAGLGSIPIVGDVFDVFYKSNQRNLELVLSEFPDSDPHCSDSARK
jgi:hypothetical protein